VRYAARTREAAAIGEGPGLIVDSHQHFWDLERVEYPWLVPDYGPIYRTFNPEDLDPQLRAAGIASTVLVQSANSFEDTDAMLAHAAERP
jgi:L-fuconolactonase